MKWMRRVGAMLLSFVLTLSLAAGTILVYVVADAANGWLNAKLGELSQLYETGANPEPGKIATVSGDAGGKSYGLYMFASKAGTPKLFFEWCQASGNGLYAYFGNELYSAYYTGGPGCGPNFDRAWERLAAENPQAFADAQHEFVQARFYDQLVAGVQSSVPGFNINNYSIALQNVFWSRAVQHGVQGATNVVTRAFAAMGGFKNQSESELINAIYAESGKLTTDSAARMSGSTADKYGVTGKSLAYYTGCSGDVQLGVYIRLNINEPADAQIMLYNNTSPLVDEGVYRLSTGTDLYISKNDANQLSLAAGGTDLRLTYFASDYYTIGVEGTSLRLAMTGGQPALQEAGAGNNQMWALENVNGGYALKNRETGTYLSGGAGGALTASAAENAAAWRLSPAGNGWSTSGMFYPSQANKLTAGSSSFPIRGTITSNSRITNVTVTIEGSGIAVNAYPNAYRYELKSMDARIPISRLNAGNYVFVVRATNQSGQTELVRSPFTVYPSVTATVTFDPSGGTLSGSATATKTVGSTYGTLPTATGPEGAPFVGWFNAAGEQVTDSTTVPAGNHTLYARYGQVHTYAFVGSDGSTILATGRLTAGSLIPAPQSPAPYSDGTNAYTFSHWQSGSAVYEAGVTIMPAEDIVFVARYTAQPLGSGGGGSSGGGGGSGTVTPSGTNLTGFWPGTDVSALGSMGATVYTSDGKTAVSGGYVGTGMVAVIGNTSYVIVVTGDVNGDGKLTITDVVKLQAHVVGRAALSGAYAEAGDINKSGGITITDVVQAAQVTVGKRTIG